MFDKNSCTFTGRPTQDGEIKVTPSGKHCLSFSLALNTGRNKDGTDRPAIFVNCVAWETLADNLERFVFKGKPLLIDCQYAPRSYEKDGQRRVMHEFRVIDFKPMFQRDNGVQYVQPVQTNLGGDKDLLGYSIQDEDLPFF